MSFTVKIVEGVEAKSKQEVEALLIAKDAEANAAAAAAAAEAAEEEKKKGSEITIDDDAVISFLKTKHNKQISSIEDLFANQKEDLPEDVASFLKFKKETGRGVYDFVKVNTDLSKLSDDQAIKEFYAITNPELNSEDIEVMVGELTPDELDDDLTKRKLVVSKKKIVSEARKYLTEAQSKYKAPLESSAASLSSEEKEILSNYKKRSESAEKEREKLEKKGKWFKEKSDLVFGQDFKGFEFDIDKKKLIFNPGDAKELQKAQETPMNFISKFLDEEGLIKDAAGYHRSLAIAMNPEKFAKSFYDQGLATGTEELLKKQKNIQMSERRTPEVSTKGGATVKALSSPSGSGLKIKSIR